MPENENKQAEKERKDKVLESQLKPDFSEDSDKIEPELLGAGESPFVQRQQLVRRMLIAIGGVVVLALVAWGLWAVLSRAIPERGARPQGPQGLSWEFKNLAPLQSGHYEGWAVMEDGRAVSTGKFMIQGNRMIDLQGRLIQENHVPLTAAGATSIMITVEAEGDADDLPSDTVVLRGDMTEGEARLAFSPIDLSSIGGSFMLATPTNGYPPSSREESGIWFVTGDDLPGLDLPEAPAGWAYQAWARAKDTDLNIGRFRSVVGSDGFDGYSSVREAPEFPGEDFLRNPPDEFPGRFPLDLADENALIYLTLEPDHSGTDPTGSLPSSLVILMAKVPESADERTSIHMNASGSRLPSGSARID